jgi:aromatic ring hydroxylase-like protein
VPTSEGVFLDVPGAGDRAPDAPMSDGSGAPSLHDVFSGLGFDVVRFDPLGEPPDPDVERAVQAITDEIDDVRVHVVGGALARARYGVLGPSIYLIRPDGHIAFRAAGPDLERAGKLARRAIGR